MFAFALEMNTPSVLCYVFTLARSIVERVESLPTALPCLCSFEGTCTLPLDQSIAWLRVQPQGGDRVKFDLTEGL